MTKPVEIGIDLPKGWRAWGNDPVIYHDEDWPEDLWYATWPGKWILDVGCHDNKYVVQVVEFKSLRELAKDKEDLQAMLDYNEGCGPDEKIFGHWEEPHAYGEFDTLEGVRDFCHEWLEKLK